MLVSTAIGAGDRLPVGYAMLVIVLLSLLLWAIALILLWRLFDAERVGDFQESTKRRLMLRSWFPAIHSGRLGIAAAGFKGLHGAGKTGPIGLAHGGPPPLDELRQFIGNV